MIAGHAPIAFALAAAGAAAIGIDRRRALALGLAAGAFAVVPDVDMTYAVVGLLGTDVAGVWGAVSVFWDRSAAVHRAMTHSLVLAVPAAAGFALAAGGRRHRLAAAALLAGLVAAGLVAGGPLGAAMLSLYAAAGVVVSLAGSRYGLGVRGLLAAALVGLGSHPFGDFFTGTPPRVLYPLGVRVFDARLALHPDPTLNLLAIFGLELAAIWLAVAVAARLLDRPLREGVDPRAAAGAGYGLAAFVLPAPTLDVSYHFVFSVLAVGSVGAVPLAGRRLPVMCLPSSDRFARAAMTGLSAVTLGVAAYTAVYLLA